MTDDGTRSVVHLAVGARSSVVIAEEQTSVHVVKVHDAWIGEIPVVIGVQGRAVRRTIGAPQTRDAVGIGGIVRATNVHHVADGDITVCNKARFDQLRAGGGSIGSPNGVVSVGRSGLDREVEMVIG